MRMRRWSHWSANNPCNDVLRSMVTDDLGVGAERRILAARHAEEVFAFIVANRAYLDDCATTLAMIIRS